MTDLTPTHFVRADGADSNSGTSVTAAWRTVERARAYAPSGAVVQVGPGQFVGQETAIGVAGRYQPISWLGEYPSSAYPTRPDLWSVLEGGLRASPASVVAPGLASGPWTQVPLAGPTDGVVRTVWRWAGAGALTRLSLGYGDERLATPQRVAHWKADTLRLSGPAGWSELVATNRSQRSGYYQAGADIYLVMPVARNPNDLWWTAGSGCGIAVSAPGCRVSGLVLRGWDRAVQIGPYSSNFRWDDCRVETSNNAIVSVGSPPSIYPVGVTVEDNDLVNTGLWSDDQVASPSASWVHIKDKIKLADGSRYPTIRVGGAMEGVGVYLTACRDVEIRRNLIDGYQNGIGSRIVQAFDTGASSEWSIHDNRIVHIQDDAIEPEGQASNWRIYRNEVMDASTFLSTAPVHRGPLYVWSNRVTVGLRGLARDLDGIVDGAASLGFKYSRASSPQAHVYVTGNTIADDGESAVSGGSQFAAGSGQPEFYHLVNNLIVVSRNGWEYWPGQFEERSNQFSTTDPVRGMKNLATQTTYSSFPAYQANSGQGVGSCPLDLHDRAALVALVDEDLRLTAAGYTTLIGGVVPGIPGGATVFGSAA